MHKNTSQVRSEGLMAVTIQTAMFWDMIPCSLHGQSLIFCTNTLLLTDALKVRASGSCVLICIHQATQHHIPEDSNLYSIVQHYLVVKALRYKPAGRGFGSPWCHWNFSVI